MVVLGAGYLLQIVRLSKYYGTGIRYTTSAQQAYSWMSQCQLSTLTVCMTPGEDNQSLHVPGRAEANAPTYAQAISNIYQNCRKMTSRNSIPSHYNNHNISFS